MQPSGLIFLVIIAIWAAYLLQHWVRRREHLATARSVDRFSDAMRVLERRTPLPETDLSLPQPRSYSVSPARPSRPDVVVKRAQSPRPNVQTPAAAVRSTRVFHSMTGISARRVRGLSFLASLSLVAVASTLAAFAVMTWWSVPIAVGVLVTDFAWLRHASVTERSARRAEGPVGRAGAPARVAGHVAAPAASRPASRVEPEIATPVVTAEVAELSEASADSQVEVDLSGWAPVPVPPPTYTLKAKAERHEPVPAAVSAPTTVQPAGFDGAFDEDELDDLLDRRRAAGA